MMTSDRARDAQGRWTSTKLVHGTASGYKRGCKCRDCRAANAEYMREYRLRTGRTRRSVAPDRQYRQHGTRSCYVRGCREPECVEANRKYQREYMRLRRQGIPMKPDWE